MISFVIDNVFSLRDGFVLTPGFDEAVGANMGEFLRLSDANTTVCSWIAGFEIPRPRTKKETAIFIRDPYCPHPRAGMTATLIEPNSSTVGAMNQNLAVQFDLVFPTFQKAMGAGSKLARRPFGKPSLITVQVFPSLEVLTLLNMKMNFYDGKSTLLELNVADFICFLSLSDSEFFIRLRSKEDYVDLLFSTWQRIA